MYSHRVKVSYFGGVSNRSLCNFTVVEPDVKKKKPRHMQFAVVIFQAGKRKFTIHIRIEPLSHRSRSNTAAKRIDNFIY